MRSNDLWDVADTECLLGLVQHGLQLIDTQVHTERLLFFEKRSLQLSWFVVTTVRCSSRELENAYLLSGAVRMVQVDDDLTLTRTEHVHRERGGTPHPVPCPLDTWSRKHHLISQHTLTN